MPELPEVETVRRILSTQIIGLKINDVKVKYPRLLENSNPITFTQKLIGQTFRKIDRIGKYLIFYLDQVSLIVHLRMEGKFYLYPCPQQLTSHEHLAITFTNNQFLTYHDTRKFGKVVILPTTDFKQICQYRSLAKLAPDANTDIDPLLFHQQIIKHQIAIKTLLLNQEIIAGLGNIYVNEVLYLAHINPLLPSNLLTLEQVKLILKYSKIVLNEAINQGGTTIKSYTSSLGVTGLFQQQLNVHGRNKLECKKCHQIIKKIKVNGRGTYYCPNCQPILASTFPVLNPHIKKIVITGLVGTGKSTLLNLLNQLGYNTISADQIVSLLYQDEMVRNQVVKLLDLDSFDHQVIRDKVFNNHQLRKRLNDYIHPLVYQKIDQLIKQSFDQDQNFDQKIDHIFIEIPLLTKANMIDFADQVWILNCDLETIKNRLIKNRGYSLELINQIIANQDSLSTLTEFLDQHQCQYYVINTNHNDWLYQ